MVPGKQTSSVTRTSFPTLGNGTGHPPARQLGRALSRRVRLVEGHCQEGSLMEGHCQEGSDWWKGIVKKGQTNGRTLSRRAGLMEGHCQERFD